MTDATASRQAPLVVHVVYRFDVGGLENGVVNLINHMPAGAYRHAVVALTEITDFRRRVEREDVEFIALAKPPGHALRLYPRLFRLFRRLRPAIVHTRNLSALEAVVPARAAGAAACIHGEHGRDVGDLDGSNRKYQWLRRLYRPFVTYYIALSRDLEHYLTGKVGVPAARVCQIYNGVDTRRFRPADARRAIAGCPFVGENLWLVGTVGRMQTVKNQTGLAEAFVLALERSPELAASLRLVMVGEGPLREASRAILERAGCAHLAWLPGERDDVPEVLRGLDCFALPSLAEGVSNTILEAMASGLPVLATDVGGNAELVANGKTGRLVPPGDAPALAAEIAALAARREEARQLGRAGREAAERGFSLAAMVDRYRELYDRALERRA
ncbi:MAG: TIGR03088 family PEP-CTERM/XrtA system glycosyltransferase [Candidatus Accumulibacter sp.]|jgi:sugar transferase (PEP-CTERM/EpsH1 system associated)|nr:TIGR03088 family PEP-CTERM/XrtA system glycosyltransferase [Accumulibacter sp.]